MTKITKSSNELLKVENLAVSFRSGAAEVQAVRGVSFSLNKGELLAIVGESGSGKSVTALSLMQLLPYPMAYHPSGSIEFEGKELVNLPEREMRSMRGAKISMIFQEPMTSLNPLHTIEKQICEVLFLHKNMTASVARKRCLELLDLVELGALKNRLGTYPHELSGGQRQRIMIAMALACEPELLIADEPTTALDVTIQLQILKLLKDLQQKMGMAILLITHDLTIVKRVADYVGVMHKGQMVEIGKTADIFASPSHEYTRHLLSSEPKGRAIALDGNAPLILNTQNLKVSFPIKKSFFGKPLEFVHAVKDASIELKSGETLGIVGESGSGKSTLAFAILRLISSSGVINFNNKRIDTISGESIRPMRREMQIVFQDPFASLNPRMTVFQLIEEGLKAHNIGESQAERYAMVAKTIQEVGLSADMLERYPHEFSGGQRQRIAIARALVLNPKLIILDEPTSALDLSVQAQIIDLLRKLQTEKNLSYIFISHDLRVIRSISHRVIVMKNGDIVESGTTDAIFDKPQSEYTKVLINAAGVR